MYTHTATHAVKHKPRPRGRVVHFSLIFFWVFSVFLLHVHKHTVEGRGRVVGGGSQKGGRAQCWCLLRWTDGAEIVKQPQPRQQRSVFCGGQMALGSSSSRDNNLVSFAVDRWRHDRKAAATTTTFETAPYRLHHRDHHHWKQKKL